MIQMVSGSIWKLNSALKAHVPQSVLIEDPVLRFKNELVLHGLYSLRKCVVYETGAVWKEMAIGVFLHAGTSLMD